MQQVFICSPYRGDIEHNVKVARDAGRIAAKIGYVPVIPHLVYPQFQTRVAPFSSARNSAFTRSSMDSVSGVMRSSLSS